MAQQINLSRGYSRAIPFPGQVKVRGRLLLLAFLEFSYLFILLSVMAGCVVVGFFAIRFLGFGVLYFRAIILISLGSVFVTCAAGLRVFRAPRPRLHFKAHADHYPLLWNLVKEVASTLRTRMPNELYFDPKVIAGVREEGGFLGIGRKRQLVIGLPLFYFLTVSEFKAVMAHEFAHFINADSWLVAWHKRASDRVLSVWDAASETGGRSFLSVISMLYAKLLLNAMPKITVLQEFAADETAAETYGAAVTISALEKCLYWSVLQSEFVRLYFHDALNRGDNVFQAFKHFAKSADEAGAFRSVIDEALAVLPEPHDSHPTLNERTVFCKRCASANLPKDDRLSLVLMPDLARVESDLHKWLAAEHRL